MRVADSNIIILSPLVQLFLHPFSNITITMFDELKLSSVKKTQTMMVAEVVGL